MQIETTACVLGYFYNNDLATGFKRTNNQQDILDIW